MTRDQIYQVTDILRFLPLGLALLAGVVGIWLLSRQPRRDRGDRSLALTLTGVAALIAAVGVLFIAGALGSAWGGSAGAGLVAGVPLAVGAAVIVFLAGIGGYALLARPTVGRVALIGILAGPLLLAGVTTTVVRLTDQPRWDADRTMLQAEQDQARRAAEARNSSLHVSARDARIVLVPFHDPASGTDTTVVGSVRLTLVLRADVPIDFYGPDVGYPMVRLLPKGDSGLAEMRGTWPADTGSHLPVGDTVWTVDFAYTPDQLAGRMSAAPHGPGSWIVQLSIMGDAGGYSVEAPIELVAPGASG